MAEEIRERDIADLQVLMAVLFACAVGSLPSCETMGGGGMKYLAEPPPAAAAVSV